MMPLRRLGVIAVFALLAACNATENPVERSLVELGSAEECDASVQPCLLAHQGVTLRLELDKNVRTMQPFQLQLHVEGASQPVETVMVEFFMEGMDMGVNRYRLLNKDNSWQGVITLPVCVAGTGIWRAEVEVSDQKHRYRGIFRFHSSS